MPKDPRHYKFIELVPQTASSHDALPGVPMQAWYREYGHPLK